MKNLFLVSFVFLSSAILGQNNSLKFGTYKDNSLTSIYPELTLNSDSTFLYDSKFNPYLSIPESFHGIGKWTVRKDTLLLNGEFPSFPIETNLTEEQVNSDSLIFTFNLIRQYCDSEGMIVKVDTTAFQQVSLALNQMKKKHFVKNGHNFRGCLFAHNVPALFLDKSRTAIIPKTDSLFRFFVGAYELKGFKEFKIVNPKSNKFIVNEIYKENVETKIRSIKYLINDKNQIYINRKPDGTFEKDNMWWGEADKLTLQE